MQSTSLWQHLINGTQVPEEDVLTEYYNLLVCNFGPPCENYSTMVRSGQYKLSLCHGTGEGELYDLSNDPNETINYFNDTNYAQIKIDMLIRMSNKQAWSTDPLPERICRF